MKIAGVEVETEPFTDKKLDLAIESIDFVVKVNQIDLKSILEVCNLINSEGHSIGYIHRYPSDNTTTIGVKTRNERI